MTGGDAGVGDRPAAGRLLVATPSLVDPNFANAVVLLLDHDGDGSLGVVLNRPSAITVAAVLPDWAGSVDPPEVLFEGGPVSTDAAPGGLWSAVLRRQPGSLAWVSTRPADPTLN